MPDRGPLAVSDGYSLAYPSGTGLGHGRPGGRQKIPWSGSLLPATGLTRIIAGDWLHRVSSPALSAPRPILKGSVAPAHFHAVAASPRHARLIRKRSLGANVGAIRANDFPRPANESGRAGGDHASLRTDPDDTERDTGIYESEGGPGAAAVPLRSSGHKDCVPGRLATGDGHANRVRARGVRPIERPIGVRHGYSVLLPPAPGVPSAGSDLACHPASQGQSPTPTTNP
jgi:hypothetical protein